MRNECHWKTAGRMIDDIDEEIDEAIDENIAFYLVRKGAAMREYQNDKMLMK